MCAFEPYFPKAPFICTDVCYIPHLCYRHQLLKFKIVFETSVPSFGSLEYIYDYFDDCVAWLPVLPWLLLLLWLLHLPWLPWLLCFDG